MDLNNPPKFYLLLVTLIGVFGLMLFGRVDTDNAQAWALIGSIVGYGVGNGIAARNGQNVEPVFRRRTGSVDSGRIDVATLFAWFIVGALLTGGLASLALLGGAAVCGWSP